ncbi:MAG: tyrosine-protein phosphatase [Anaerostipes sp.]|nr:tyrosine-protein phosphatase [Anaerostipes sp.]
MDGSLIRWNRLYRGDCLAFLTPDEWSKLENCGIVSVIDLRSKSETLLMKDQIPQTMEYFHCPLQEDEIDFSNAAESASKAFTKSLADGYQKILSDSPDLLAAAVKTVIQCLEKGGVLFHCTAGKDRTGVLAAVLLTLLGAAREDIIADYQVSFTYNEQGINKAAAGLPDYQAMLPMLRSDAETIEQLLQCFEKFDLGSHLIQHGLDAADLDHLKDLALERISL